MGQEAKKDCIVKRLGTGDTEQQAWESAAAKIDNEKIKEEQSIWTDEDMVSFGRFCATNKNYTSYSEALTEYKLKTHNQ